MQYDLSQPLLSAGIADAAQIDAWFHARNANAPPLGADIVAVCQEMKLNSDFIAAEIDDETGTWTSRIANDKDNPSGFGAIDSDPYGAAITFPSIRAGIEATGAHWRTYIDGATNPFAAQDPRYAVLLTTGHAGTVHTVGDIGAGIWASAKNYNTSVLTRMNDLVATLAPPVTPPAEDPTNPAPLPPDAPQDDPTPAMRAKIAAMDHVLVGQTAMGPGLMLNTPDGSTHVLAEWCEQAQEMLMFAITGERVAFPDAWDHAMILKREGHLDPDPTTAQVADFDFYGPYDGNGHITNRGDDGLTYGTTVTPNGWAGLPVNHYPNYVGHATPEEVLLAAKKLPPADPTGGGLGRRDPDGNRLFVWLLDPDTGKVVGLGGGFRDRWEANGPNNGRIRYGLPLINERDATNDKGVAMVVQWLERARFEWHKDDQQVYGGLIGSEWLALRLAEAAPLPAAVPPSTDYVDPHFVRYFNEHGGLAQFGYPLTTLGALPLTADGQYDGQVFQRAVLEWHPIDAATGWGVQVRRIGAELLAAYRAGTLTIRG